MNKKCFMFPGQGSQKENMGIELSKISKEAKNIFECASDIFSFNLLKASSTLPQEELNKTKYAQPLIVATNIAAFKTLEEKEVIPDFLVGHSLGQYSSLYAAKILSLEETFNILKLRIEAINQKAPTQKTKMCAIIGASKEEILNACQKASSYVVCANFNTKTQTVIAGTEKGVLEVCEILKDVARRCVILNVAFAFHCDLMLKAAKLFEEKIENIVFNPPKIPVFSNVTANIVNDGNEIKKLLVEHFTKPVLFTEILENLEKENVSCFIELGNEKILCGFIRKSLKNKILLNISDKKSFLETENFLKEEIKV